MRRLILLLATIGVAVLLASGAALGITFGKDDTQNTYSNVGALVNEEGVYCSGTLVEGKTGAPVFVTAAHCDEDGTVYVTFDWRYDAEGTNFPNGTEVEYRGTLTGDSQWYLNGHDIAVVVFDTTADLDGDNIPDYSKLIDQINNGYIKLAKLPAQGELSGIKKGQKFTAVGYGSTSATSNPDGVRRYAVSSLTSIQRYYLSLSQHGNKDNGGTCYGDSGGPNFFGSTASGDAPDINAALTNTGDAMCKATNKVLRLDTQAAHDFLNNYVDQDAFVAVPRP